MVVYAVYCPDRHGYVGTYMYISDTPKLYWTRGAAENKAKKMLRVFGEGCEIVEFELTARKP